MYNKELTFGKYKELLYILKNKETIQYDTEQKF